MEEFLLKNPVGRSIFGFLILLIISFGTTIGAGAYKTATANEGAQFEADVTSFENKPILLDLADQGLAKRLIQPGLVQIRTGHGDGGVSNLGQQSLPIQVKLANFPNQTDLQLKTAADAKTGKLLAPLEPGTSFGMQIITKVPKEKRQQLVSVAGEIQFYHADNGTLLGKVPVYIVNSKYGNPYEELGLGNTNVEHMEHHHGGGH